MVYFDRQDILRPIGLVTQTNQFGQYPSGALRKAANVVLRNPGELLQAPSINGGGPYGAVNDIIHSMFCLDAGHHYDIVQNGTTWSVYDDGTAATLPTAVGTTNLFSATGRISPTRLNDRYIVNSTRGCLIVDYPAPANAAERALRQAGLPQPGVWVMGLSTTSAAVLPNNFMVGYAACFSRTFPDGYVIRSVPTPIFKILNTTGGVRNPSFGVTWNLNSGIIAGDALELYRTDGRASTTYNDDPGATLKLVQSYTLTSGDITNSLVTITDTTQFVQGTITATKATTPGTQLYTNGLQDNQDYANDQPPLAGCQAAFKSYCFFGRYTELPFWNFSCVGGFGAEAVAIAAGVPAAYFKAFSLGRHDITGTYTNGSPTITGVAAADFVGLAVGQRFGAAAVGTPWSVISSKIQSLNSGAGTITMNANASIGSGGPVVVSFDDVVELNGLEYPFTDLCRFYQQINIDQGAIKTNYGFWDIRSSVTVPGVQLSSFTSAATVTIKPSRYAWVTPSGAAPSFTLRATNGARYSPPVPEITATAKTITGQVIKNGLKWSRQNAPDHCPVVQSTVVGSGELISLRESRDALWITTTAGVYRFSGDGGSDGLGFRNDIVSSTLVFSRPQSMTVLDEVLYGYTAQGFGGLDASGNFRNLTDQRIGNLLPGLKYVEARDVIVERVEATGEIVMGLGDNGSTASNTLYIYNTRQDGWTTLENNAAISSVTAMAYQRAPNLPSRGRLTFGFSPAGGVQPSWSGWSSTTIFLVPDVEYQPIYGDQPMGLKQFMWGDFLFATGTAGKTVTAKWDGVSAGSDVIVDIDNTGMVRIGAGYKSHSLSCGFTGLSTAAPAARFQGVSMAVKPLGNKGKKF